MSPEFFLLNFINRNSELRRLKTLPKGDILYRRFPQPGLAITLESKVVAARIVNVGSSERFQQDGRGKKIQNIQVSASCDTYVTLDILTIPK